MHFILKNQIRIVQLNVSDYLLKEFQLYLHLSYIQKKKTNTTTKEENSYGNCVYNNKKEMKMLWWCNLIRWKFGKYGKCISLWFTSELLLLFNWVVVVVVVVAICQCCCCLCLLINICCCWLFWVGFLG